MSKVWPDWHDKYDFDEFNILRFAPDEPGVFLIRRKYYEDYIKSILLIDASENLKERLLEEWENPSGRVREYLEMGEILEFSFLKTLDPFTIRDGILESLGNIANF